jgi:hypothetical protein
MKKYLVSIFFLIFIIFSFLPCFSQGSSPQSISIVILPVVRMSINSPSGFLRVSELSQSNLLPVAATANATYSISTNESGKRITCALNNTIPANTSLTLNMEAPTGATNMGDVVLSTQAKDLVRAIPACSASNLNISYTFSAYTNGQPSNAVSSSSANLTFTFLDDN